MLDDLVRSRLGFRPHDRHPLTHWPDWFYEGRCEVLRCPRENCASTSLEVWRLPAGPHPQASRYYGIVCPVCRGSFDTRELDNRAKRELREWSRSLYQAVDSDGGLAEEAASVVDNSGPRQDPDDLVRSRLPLPQEVMAQLGFTSDSDWIYQGPCDVVECPRCAQNSFHVWRKRYETTQGTYYYWGIVCSTCQKIIPRPEFDDRSYRRLLRWSKGLNPEWYPTDRNIDPTHGPHQEHLETPSAFPDREAGGTGHHTIFFEFVEDVDGPNVFDQSMVHSNRHRVQYSSLLIDPDEIVVIGDGGELLVVWPTHLVSSIRWVPATPADPVPAIPADPVQCSRCGRNTPRELAIRRSQSGLGCAGCDRPFTGITPGPSGRGSGSGSKVSLFGIDLVEGDLRNFDLRETNLANRDLTKVLLRGADIGGADLTRTDLTRVDLTGVSAQSAILTRAILTGAILRDCDFTEADLTNARMWATDLTGADAVNADFTEAFLERSVLHGTDLTGATLAHAVLKRASLYGAKLYGANLTDADVTEARFSWSFADESTIWPTGFDPVAAGVIIE